MENPQYTCATCGQIMRLIPAGVSKTTGKPYSAFYSCPNRCQKQPTVKPAQIDKTKEMKEVIDYKSERIAEAQNHKTESMTVLNAKNGAAQIVSAFINSGLVESDNWQEEFKKVFDFIYNYKPEDLIPFN